MKKASERRPTLTGTSKRKHDLQLQFPQHTGQDSAISSSGVLGYLQNKNYTW